MGKYQLDTKSKVAAAKYQDGKKPAVSNKKDKINQLREAYLQKQKDKKQSGERLDSLAK
ncbi:alcohol dehydrogenase [Exiguobacterium aurantiacum]|uniref:alcohol dehydrogenase n=1 Tax=Exiguobacterium aurantiacum TaxID=33987 RepID=UPI00384B1B3B